MGFFNKIKEMRNKYEDSYISNQKDNIARLKKRQAVNSQLYKVKAATLKSKANILKQKNALAKERAKLTKSAGSYDPLGMFTPQKQSKKKDDFGFW